MTGDNFETAVTYIYIIFLMPCFLYFKIKISRHSFYYVPVIAVKRVAIKLIFEN